MFQPFLEDARAKINLALHVLGRRSDGYHNLDSIVTFADLCDTLLFEPDNKTTLTVTGPHAVDLGTGPDNLVLKAVSALGQLVKLPSMRITLNKVLPVASGIGGGSADAAAALRGAMRASGAAFDVTMLRSVALSLGADVPVCLASATCRMQGIGDEITPLSLPESAVVLVNPRVHCNTQDVFRALGLRVGQKYLTALDPEVPESWRNDLTRAATAVRPVIVDVLATLRAHDGLHTVRMSGSGATCFGLARTLARAETAAATLSKAHPDWWIRAAKLG